MRHLLFRTISLAALCAACSQPAFAQAGGVNATGRLQNGDRALESGEYYDSYTIEAREGQRLDIRLDSEDFDPYLIVRGPGGAAFDNDDEEGGSGTNARINEIAPATGTYRINATSYQPNEMGRYRIQASATGGNNNAGRGNTGGAGGGNRAAAAINTTGRLQNGDDTLDSGEFADRYSIEVEAGQQLDIRLSSTEFDPYLIVRGPEGASFDNDDAEGEGGTNARIYETAPASGTYRISATSYQPGETGSYRLEASATGGNTATRGNGGGNRTSAGLNTTGRLQSGDGTLDSGEFADRYEIQAQAGQQLDIRLSSTEFDPYLIVRGPGGASFDNDDATGEGGTNARVYEVAPATGTYRVTATSYQPGETGSYTLVANTTGNGNGGRNMGNQGGGQAAGRHDGTLAQGDSVLNSGEFSDAYAIDGRAGQQVDIRVNSTDFDTYVMLRGPDGSSFDNDDAEGGAGGTNSRLVTTLPATGRYRLVVTSYQSGETGAYTLETRGATSVAEASTGGSGFGGGTASGNTLVSGQTVNGRLSEEDSALDSGEFFDVYTLAGEPGTQFTVEMRSSAVDTYLAALGSGGYEVTNDDDASGNNGTNSRMDVTIPESGTLTIAATSYAGGETGAYTLVARQAGFAARNISAGGGRRLALGQNVNGNLAAGEEAFMLTVDRAGPVEIALASDAFDPMLRIEGEQGFNAENDDDPNGGSLNSRIVANLPAAGTYRVIVSSYADGGAGAYSLAANTGSGAPSNGGGSVGGGATLALDRQVRGTLATADQTLSSGEYIDTYTFEGRRGQRVTFDMESADFDTYLSFLFPGGGSEENDDRAGGDGSTNSHLTVTLPNDGTYQLVATSYQPGVTGGYTITATTASASEASANPIRPNSRVFALSVGVADYQRIGGLNMTDQDALKLTQALSATGMLADESVTLVNEQATRDNFEAAVANISANIGPDDLFLIFFSGHGAKNAVDRSIERDGSSETIELFDQAVADYELEQMLTGINARTLLVLDSCFSGGFDGIINSQVGRMGVFSSDSDVTSLVADKFEAGGYISHILQLAVEGRADANRDDAITAGELSEYMRNTFYQIALAEPLESSFHDTGGNSGTGYQHIVVNRGGDGMPYEDVLVNLAPSGG